MRRETEPAHIEWSVIGICAGVGIAISLVGGSVVSILYSWIVVLTGTASLEQSAWVAYEADYVRIMGMSISAIGFMLAGRLARRMAVRDSCWNALLASALVMGVWVVLSLSPWSISQAAHLKWPAIFSYLIPAPCYLIGRKIVDVGPSVSDIQTNFKSRAWNVAAIGSKIVAGAFAVVLLGSLELQQFAPDVSAPKDTPWIAQALVSLFVVALLPVYFRSTKRWLWWFCFGLNIFMVSSLAMILLPQVPTASQSLMLVIPPLANAVALGFNRRWPSFAG